MTQIFLTGDINFHKMALYQNRIIKYISFLPLLSLLIISCRADHFTPNDPVYYDKLYGAWQAMMVANHTGLLHEGQYIDRPSDAEEIELALYDQWSTDDDTMIEWVALHIMETHGLDPTYEQIRDEWIDHVNHDIWVSTRRARDLMDEGIVPPQTSDPTLNPEAAWSIDAQLMTELYGLIAPGLPQEGMRRARYHARIMNDGPAVEFSAFYAHMISEAFFEPDVEILIANATATLALDAAEGRLCCDIPPDAQPHVIADHVHSLYLQYPDAWRSAREEIRIAYDTDPTWWGARVNFAATIMALYYGEGDLEKTMTIAGLAGWDADNNMTTAAGLLGVIYGYEQLPRKIRHATDRYYNEDGTGDLPEYDSVSNIARRTQRLGEPPVFDHHRE